MQETDRHDIVREALAVYLQAGHGVCRRGTAVDVGRQSILSQLPCWSSCWLGLPMQSLWLQTFEGQVHQCVAVFSFGNF